MFFRACVTPHNFVMFSSDDHWGQGKGAGRVISDCLCLIGLMVTARYFYLPGLWGHIKILFASRLSAGKWGVVLLFYSCFFCSILFQFQLPVCLTCLIHYFVLTSRNLEGLHSCLPVLSNDQTNPLDSTCEFSANGRLLSFPGSPESHRFDCFVVCS